MWFVHAKCCSVSHTHSLILCTKAIYGDLLLLKMEEEITYSTLSFKNGGTAPKEEKQDSTIYSKVKSKRAATSVPNGEAAARSHFCALAVCLGILCVLLLAAISAIIYISVVINQQKANLSNLTAENQQLITNRSILERETKELRRVTDNLNWTLQVILTFNTFPVNDYCPNKKCQPCQTDWLLFQEKCYLFYNKGSPWKTWQDSRTYCKNTAADLVVIDSLHEQEFISNHTEFYFDTFHGYWLGLYEKYQNWVWVDGRNDTLRYWLKEQIGSNGPCALLIPGRNSTASWDPAGCVMQNKFICERDVLTRSN
ncbi:C-type lectin domain family 12 member B-like isoform X2 [Sander lucioperca]|uniref:C-type lectin domain family 12 member B-like isoform X2 n=1 Tax=Sander lucioperca TaxID=283035 RepID=UPI00125CF17F|nr:C-type lectin domain family 12 member B-like isoform X2 [Sander lucioperca]